MLPSVILAWMSEHEQGAMDGATTGRAASRLVALVAGVLGPSTLITALAYYFSWRREEAFAGYFGIDASLLGFSTQDYLLRSVDALFAPAATLLLAAFGVLALYALVGRRVPHVYTVPVAGVVGIAALAAGLALAAGHPVSTRYIYLQALGLGVGVALVAFGLVAWRGTELGRGPSLTVVYLAVAIAVTSLFWATAEYADDRGLELARELALDLSVNPNAVLYSKTDLNIDTKAPSSGYANECEIVQLTRNKRSAYGYRYVGLTLLVHAGGRYFLTPEVDWAPGISIFVIPDDDNVRVELIRGSGYVDESRETTFAGRLAFTC